MATKKKPGPQVMWQDHGWSVSIPLDDGRVLNAKWRPGTTYVVHIRKVGTEPWGFGFETPLQGCTFTDLKPDTEYELRVRPKNKAGEGDPAFFRIRTDRAGISGNVIPFPKQP